MSSLTSVDVVLSKCQGSIGSISIVTERNIGYQSESSGHSFCDCTDARRVFREDFANISDVIVSLFSVALETVVPIPSRFHIDMECP